MAEAGRLQSEGPTLTRLERIRERLARLERAGVLVHEYTRGDGPGRRWVIIPAGHAERVLSTNELEWFMLGADAAQSVLNSAVVAGMQAASGARVTLDS